MATKIDWCVLLTPNQQNVVTPGADFIRRHVGDPATSSRVYNLDCEGSGIGYIMQNLNIRLSSSSVRFNSIDHDAYFLMFHQVSSEITAVLRKRLEIIDSSL